jgi:hypothetical protein
MKFFQNLNAIKDEIQKYMKPSATPLTFVMSSGLIKIRADVSVAFIIYDKTRTINSIEMCIYNCMIKKYMSTNDVLTLDRELQKYVGQKI